MPAVDQITFKPIVRPIVFKVDRKAISFKESGGRGPQGVPANTDFCLPFQGNLKANERFGVVFAAPGVFRDTYCFGVIDPSTKPDVDEVIGVEVNFVHIGTVTISHVDGSVSATFGTINAVRGTSIDLVVGATPSVKPQNFKFTFSGSAT